MLWAAPANKRYEPELNRVPDSLPEWVGQYFDLAVVGVCSQAVAEKAALHLGRFVESFEEAYGHDRASYRPPATSSRGIDGYQVSGF